MITGKHETQTMDEMISEMGAAKEKGLSKRRGSSIYKQTSGEYQEEKLRDLISMSLEELADVATKERVSLDNVEAVKRRTVCYMRACEESGTFPSSLGLARSLGYSDRALRHWRGKRPNSPTAQWLEIFNDMCADILNQSALKNNANNIMAIFLSKALYDFRDSNELIITSPPVGEEETQLNTDEIRSRYLLDTANDYLDE